ncbi:MAG: GtrA family protein [Rhodoglobus sp.]
MRALLGQLARFGVVGLIGLAVDAGVFNLLRTTVLEPQDVHEGPVIAKVISTSLAILANWLGNRHWTFRAERRSQVVREGVEFVLVSLGGMAISLGTLWVTHYLLGFTSLLADNVSNYGIGLVLGTAFRFAFYRQWVFHPRRNGVALRPAESPVRPARRAPLRGIKTVATVEDGPLGNK